MVNFGNSDSGNDIPRKFGRHCGIVRYAIRILQKGTEKAVSLLFNKTESCLAEFGSF